MQTILKTLLIGTACLGGFLSTADAADIIDQPYGMAPEVQPVEVGSAWYLRGDVSYDFKTDLDAHTRDFANATYTDRNHDGFEIEDGASFGVGFGYQFTDFFRGDLTANYWKQDVSGSDHSAAPCSPVTNIVAFAQTACASDESTKVRAWELMANAYVDLGTFAGFTPYAGGGVGAVNLKYDALNDVLSCQNGAGACPGVTPGTQDHEGIDSWRFAYALMAGVSYDVSRNLKLDIGYRYLDVDGGDIYGFDPSSKARGANGVQGLDDGFDRHTIQAGLRYSLF